MTKGLQDAVALAIAKRMPRQQADLIYLYFIEKWSVGELAEHFSVSRSTIHRRINKALKEVKGKLNLRVI